MFEDVLISPNGCNPLVTALALRTLEMKENSINWSVIQEKWEWIQKQLPRIVFLSSMPDFAN